MVSGSRTIAGDDFFQVSFEVKRRMFLQIFTKPLHSRDQIAAILQEIRFVALDAKKQQFRHLRQKGIKAGLKEKTGLERMVLRRLQTPLFKLE